ncbi:MAG TPA: DMT family transporter [Candidatus Polarisedimenticolaceae bacterium]|nr:DMT family transporter [Candidatus Polarisedimenticolaceae bacterium]
MHRSTNTLAVTAFALTAFAANSLLCRLALGRGAIDAASFSAIRLLAGAAALSAIVRVWRPGRQGVGGTWASASMLVLYAIPFSFAYRSLGAGTGALVLFASVQTTMLAAGIIAGERPGARQISGILLAIAGLVYLVSPGLSAPSPTGCALMAVAGIAWGGYTLRGRRVSDPLGETAGNFVRSIPFAAAVGLLALPRFHVTSSGALLAVLSGAIASGLGYVSWYAALRGLSATRAASLQLAVPVLTAVGGVMFLSERVTMRLVAASILILGGVALARE